MDVQCSAKINPVSRTDHAKLGRNAVIRGFGGVAAVDIARVIFFIIVLLHALAANRWTSQVFDQQCLRRLISTGDEYAPDDIAIGRYGEGAMRKDRAEGD